MINYVGKIYFIRPVSMIGPVKIGFSTLPEARLKALALWSPFPLEIVASCPGTPELEFNIQDCLWAAHSHKEWFFPTKKVLYVISALMRGVPIEMAVDLTDRSAAATRPSRGTWTDEQKRTNRARREVAKLANEPDRARAAP